MQKPNERLVIFLPRDAMHSEYYGIARYPCVCPLSVCLFVTCPYCVKMATLIIKRFHRRVATPHHSSFITPNIVAVANGDT